MSGPVNVTLSNPWSLMGCSATQASIERVFKEKGGKNLHLPKMWLERSPPHYLSLTILKILSGISKYQLRTSFLHLHNFLSCSLFFCLHIHSSVCCLIIISYFWANDLTRKMYLAVIFVSSLTACCESVLQLMAIDPVMHISSVILSPQSVTFFSFSLYNN